MKIDVALTVNHIKQDEMHKKTVIVIDTLRATSTIVTALFQGCRKVIPVETVGQALQFNGHQDTILIGERYTKKVAGFDYGNSPSELSKINLTNKTVVITSTNGTKALQKVKKACHILVGSFLNASHCLEQAVKMKRDITIVCAGTRGEFAIEDGLTAGFMIHHLREKIADAECSDIALMLENSFKRKQKDQLNEIIARGATGKRLIQTAQEEDVQYCLQVDQYHLTGIYKDDGIVQLLDG